MADVVDALAQASGGQQRPGGNPNAVPGSAAPATPGKPAGSPSTPSSDDAIVAAKKQAEHWRNKYERDVGDVNALKEKVAKLEGLAEGLSVGNGTAKKSNPASWQEADDSVLSDAIKKGIEEQNPTLVEMATKEQTRREIEKVRASVLEEADKRSRAVVQETTQRQQVLRDIVSTFGADVMNEDSELRRRADELYFQKVKLYGEEAVRRMPDTAFDCFARAQVEVQAKRAPEIAAREQKLADIEARQELERSSVVGAARTKTEVSDLLARGDKRGALRASIPWLRKQG